MLKQILYIEDNELLKYDLKSLAQTLAKFYSLLAEYLHKNLPSSPNKFGINSFIEILQKHRTKR